MNNHPKANRPNHRPSGSKPAAGFTLVEIVVVVLVIGILAMLTRPVIARIRLRSAAAAYWNDCRVFSEAFYRYAQEKGNFPLDQNGPTVPPPGMAGYINMNQWQRVTPIGGTYDWDNITAGNSLGVNFRGAIRVNGCTLPLAQVQQIDRWYDNGNISTGNFRATDGGRTVFFILEAK